MNAFAEATASEGTILWLHDFADASARLQGPDISFASHVRVAPNLMKSYAQHYTYTNVWMKSISALPEGEVADSSSVYPESRLHASEFYADWLRPQGIGYALGGPILKRGSVVAMFSLLRPERRGSYEERQLQLMQMLMPHLRRACLLHQRLVRLRAERSSGLAALEPLPTAVCLLDADGRLLFVNRAGRELDGCHDGMWIERDGRPTASDPSAREALQRCIAATIAAGSGLGLASDSALRIRRDRRAEPLHVMLYPLGRDALLAGSAAAIFIFDPATSPVSDADVLKTLYDLTPAEARLACALTLEV